MHHHVLPIALALLMVGCTPDTGFNIKPEDDPIIVDEGEMTVEPLELHFDDLVVGESIPLPITLTNVGDSELHLKSGRVIDSASGAFLTDEEANADVFLETGESWDMLVVCEISEATEVEGLFRIQSNDADTPALDIPLFGHPGLP